MSKTILITGASSGIGQAAALALASTDNCLILVSMKNKEGLENTAKKAKEKGADVLTFSADVSDYEACKSLLAQANEHFGPIDLLINNAGISHIGLLQDMTYEQWQHVINTNLSSVFSCCKYALPDMLHKKSGRILNISSVWGNVGASCEVAYSASKGAVNSFTKALAKEVAPSGISVNAIACGTIDTSMNACFSAEERADLESEIPCGRYGTPVETAELAYAIVSQSPYLTGQIITLDGGWC